ncbi:MAG: hypothetical protein BMS9Abin05_1576 [Rhodothermia bacterium]|nr:MAG: hypothetical protein BMS9Abin05_1576 [Rhodothermia bacterium]
MIRIIGIGILLILVTGRLVTAAQDQPLVGSIEDFEILESDLTLSRRAQPNTFFDKTGRRFAVLGVESGAFEAWAYPIKLFRDFSLSFFIGSSTQPILASDIVSRIDVRPEATTITYVFQSFTIRAHYITAIQDAGAVILLDVDSTEPLTIVAGFIPVLQPMWPAGIGGQYVSWDSDRRAYLISEPSRKNHGYVGSSAAEGISYTPAHMLSDQPIQFQIRIMDPETAKGRFIPIVMAGGTGDRETVKSVYEKLVSDPQQVYRESREHFKALRQQTLRIDTPVESLDLALEWSKVAYDNLLVSNPHLSGIGLIAGLDRSGPGGRPGFGWFFGGDAYINALSLNALGYFEAAKNAISFMTQFQRNDGKMAHEVTQATEYVDWFGDYPYAYIHADTSPYFIVAVDDYFQSTGDLDFVRDQWDALTRAYEWSLSTDGNGDGLMDNTLAGLGALEFGALTGIQSDIYLSAVWIRATEVMIRLADLLGEEDLSGRVEADHKSAATAFEKYWSEDTGHYVYAFNQAGDLVEEITPWSAVGLMFGFGTDERARSSLLRIARADLTSDWGVRMLSTESRYFEPLNYNYGAVWPFLTSWVTTAQYRRGLPLQGYSSLMSTVQHVFNRSLGQVTELLSGIRHTWPQESVPHQGFGTAGTVLPLVRGLLGLSFEDGGSTFVFRPALPGDWERTRIENFSTGDQHLDMLIERKPSKLSVVMEPDTDEEIRLIFEPVLAPGTSVTGVRVNGSVSDFTGSDTGFVSQPSIRSTLAGRTVIELDLEPAFEILPPVWKSNIGDANRGLRINRYERVGDRATLVVEGLAGREYRLRVLESNEIAYLDGARLFEDIMIFVMPDGPRGTYLQRTVNLRFGE